MAEYTTQMDAARKGIVTPEMKAVSEYENMDVEVLRDLVAKGQVAIPANKNHKCLKPYGIGSKLKTKINVNLGTSRDCMDMDVEMQKVQAAIDMGAEAIMDLSSFGDTQKFRRKLTSECPAVLGTVPIYDAVVYYNKALKSITSDEWMDIVRIDVYKRQINERSEAHMPMCGTFSSKCRTDSNRHGMGTKKQKQRWHCLCRSA